VYFDFIRVIQRDSNSELCFISAERFSSHPSRVHCFGFVRSFVHVCANSSLAQNSPEKSVFRKILQLEHQDKQIYYAKNWMIVHFVVIALTPNSIIIITALRFTKALRAIRFKLLISTRSFYKL
jgi:hypothetical protein